MTDFLSSSKFKFLKVPKRYSDISDEAFDLLYAGVEKYKEFFPFIKSSSAFTLKVRDLFHDEPSFILCGWAGYFDLYDFYACCVLLRRVLPYFQPAASQAYDDLCKIIHILSYIIVKFIHNDTT